MRSDNDGIDSQFALGALGSVVCGEFRVCLINNQIALRTDRYRRMIILDLALIGSVPLAVLTPRGRVVAINWKALY